MKELIKQVKLQFPKIIENNTCNSIAVKTGLNHNLVWRQLNEISPVSIPFLIRMEEAGYINTKGLIL